MGVKCFLLVPTDKVDRRLRRYSRKSDCPHDDGHSWCHDASVPLDVIHESQRDTQDNDDVWPYDDPRWPKVCEHCGYVFQPDDTWQLFNEHLWRRQDTGEEMTIRNAPPGAMWDAHWLHDIPNRCGPDGRSIFVKLPNGHVWHIDGRASNCTLPNDAAHRCWVRHGEPPDLTVDKNGLTCGAGAGSIQGGNWHGFLRNGELAE